MNLKEYIREVPNFPIEGVNFKDITPILENPIVFQYTVDQIIKYCQEQDIDVIISPDARGWLWASPVALSLGLPLHIVRKAGKLPPSTKDIVYEYEYASGHLEIKDHIDMRDRKICIIDDVNATGGTALAIAKLLAEHEFDKICYASVIDLPFLGGKEMLNSNGIKTYRITSYDGE